MTEDKQDLPSPEDAGMSKGRPSEGRSTEIRPQLAGERKMTAYGVSLYRWQWEELRRTLDQMNNGGCKVGVMRFFEGGIHFQAVPPPDLKSAPKQKRRINVV